MCSRQSERQTAAPLTKIAEKSSLGKRNKVTEKTGKRRNDKRTG
jgi:hypothetical protein